jgi:hypothetical protein
LVYFFELELWKLDFGWPKGCPWPLMNWKLS